MTLHWEKLSPAEFQQLHDFASYSSKKLKDVMEELSGETGPLSKYNPDGDIDYEGFKLFLNTYLEIDTPDELCRHLFLSFIKRPALRPPASPIPMSNSVPVDGRAIKEMAMMSSTTAVAAIAPHNAGSLSSLVAHSTTQQDHNIPTTEKHHGLAEKLHGLTEKLHNLGHHRSDSESGSRPRTGSLGASVHPMVKLTQTSSYYSPDDRKSTDSSPSLSQVSRNSSKNSNSNHSSKLVTNDLRSSSTGSRLPPIDITSVRVPLKDIVCYLSLLEGGRPEDKLEFMFRLYDTDGNGVLDTYELDSIVNQMMNVAEYLGWDVSELKPILQDMMVEIDYDADGTVSLEEWKRGGLTTIPLLVLLGLDQNFKEDGNHLWRLKNFNRPAYCNLCLQILVGLGKKGLCCVVCKYTVHERCVQKAPMNCISTYAKSRKSPEEMTHHWVEGNCHGICSKCKKAIKSFNGITGMHCRWCQMTLHNRCAASVKPECTLGEYRAFVLPPTSICPIVLDRQRSFSRDRRSNSGLPRSDTSDPLPPLPGETSNTAVTQAPDSSGPTSFQITPLDNTRPLIVFINPKSGGCQGPKLFRRFQYILNPRQVYNLAAGGPTKALQMFKDVPNIRIICCGGDGTVGWILDSMDKVQFASQPSVGVIPLGTGNDLARCLRWGGGYEGEALDKILKKIDKATAVMMDRWQITVSDVTDTDCPGDPMPYNIVNNYFSVGVDAAICVKFHLEREKNPHKFNSRMRNKMWYFEFGMSEQFASSCKNLHQEIEIECDGVSLELSQGPSLQGLALLNIPYTHGGTNMWGDQLSRKRAKRQPKRKKKERDKDASTSSFSDLHTAVQDIGDNLIEVVGLENSLHMGQVRTGLRASGRRLAQCSSIVIKTKKRFPMQIDGEPWMQPPSTIRVTHKNQVPMLMASSSERRGIFSFFKND